MRRTVLFLLVLALLGTAAMAGLPHRPPEPSGIDRYRRAETLVYSERGSTSEIASLLEDVRRELGRETDSALRSYWIARTHLLMATHHNRQEDRGAAEEEVELGFVAIEDALNGAGEFSDGLRVQADLHAQMMFARGPIYMARHGVKARRQALLALELAPDNIRARITAAGFYLNAPRIAGGDTDEGIAVLVEALDQGPENENERFVVLGLLAEAYVEAGDPARAARHLQQAEEIYADSLWLAELRAQVGS